MPTFDLPWDLISKIILAGILGGSIGIERDLHARPAGLRTNLIIAVGACLFGILSGKGYADEIGTQDPTRIASIVVQGIGFIGAGVLIQGENFVAGLTTAATIWLVAAVGVAVGAGMESLAIVVTIISLFALVALEPLSERLEQIGIRRAKAKDEKPIRGR